jgi:hypothetical protein
VTALDRFVSAARALGIEPDIRRFPQGTKTAADAPPLPPPPAPPPPPPPPRGHRL